MLDPGYGGPGSGKDEMGWGLEKVRENGNRIKGWMERIGQEREGN
jgi:hypothetical protein